MDFITPFQTFCLLYFFLTFTFFINYFTQPIFLFAYTNSELSKWLKSHVIWLTWNFQKTCLKIFQILLSILFFPTLTHSLLRFTYILFFIFQSYCLMQLLTSYSNHFKFLHNIFKYIFDFLPYSLFSHTHSFILALHIIILLLQFCSLVQQLTCHSNHLKF